jgi:hypothetical protein
MLRDPELSASFTIAIIELQCQHVKAAYRACCDHTLECRR